VNITGQQSAETQYKVTEQVCTEISALKSGSNPNKKLDYSDRGIIIIIQENVCY
jgi:hypothetical protein